MSLSKPIDQIVTTDLQGLVEDGEIEKQTIEYKETIKLDVQQNKDEFRRDISSFANASGGDYIVGIREKDGVPVELCGMQLENQDAFKLRLEEILQSNIRPRISGVQIQPIPLQNNLFAVVIRVPRSFARPHQVTVNKDDFQFYTRNSGGKYRLDVDQLRTAFILSETLEDRIRNFRQDRLGSIIAGETPFKVSVGPKLILHLIPLNAFEGISRYDLSKKYQLPIPLSSAGANFRFNFDGLLTYNGYFKEGADPASFVQVYRNGIVEAVNTDIVDREYQEVKYLPISFCESQLVESLGSYLDFQRQLGVDAPVLIMLSILNVKGRILPPSQPYFTGDASPIDRDNLIVPGVVAEGNESDIGSLLRPIFDALWNAVGWQKSPSYDSEGVWHQRSY